VIYYGYDAKTGEQSSASLGDVVRPEKLLWKVKERNLDRRIVNEAFGDGDRFGNDDRLRLRCARLSANATAVFDRPKRELLPRRAGPPGQRRVIM
jgi:hypothetical protein